MHFLELAMPKSFFFLIEDCLELKLLAIPESKYIERKKIS